MTRAYILHSYKDIIKDKNDIEEIKYYQGKRIIKNLNIQKIGIQQLNFLTNYY